MAQPQQPDFWRIANMALLVYVAMLLMDYAPLVPKAVTFMNDVHDLRAKSAGWQKTAEEIQKSLSVVEKLVSYFKSEAERQGRPWPTK